MPATTITAKEVFDRPGLIALAAGHFVVDMLVGALPALLPLFVREYQLSDLAASMVLGSSLAASSATQPFFGWLADRRPAPWLLWGGIVLAAIAMAAIPLVGTYPALLSLVVISGLGVAAYHPEAARVANQISAGRPATGLAWFMVGGNAGFAAGPLLAALTVPWMGVNAVIVFLVPAAIAVALIARQHQRLQPSVHHARGARRQAPSHVFGISVLLVVTTMRTWTQFVVLALVPLVLTQQHGLSDQTAGMAVFAFSGAGAAGTIVGARMADQLGGRRMLAWTMPLAAPFVLGTAIGSIPVVMVCMAGAGFILLSSFSVTVAMGQEYLPSRLALAAGLMIGFGSIGSAPPGLALFGWIADATSRSAALLSLAALPVIGGLLAFTLPRPHRTRRT